MKKISKVMAVVGLSLFLSLPAFAKVEERSLTTTSTSTPEARQSLPAAASTSSAAPDAEKAKSNFSEGFKGVGSGFKHGAKVTGHAFKKFGHTTARTFTKAGLAVKNFFAGIGKKKDKVEEKTVTSTSSTTTSTVVSETTTPSTYSDVQPRSDAELDAVGNESAAKKGLAERNASKKSQKY